MLADRPNYMFEAAFCCQLFPSYRLLSRMTAMSRPYSRSSKLAELKSFTTKKAFHDCLGDANTTLQVGDHLGVALISRAEVCRSFDHCSISMLCKGKLVNLCKNTLRIYGETGKSLDLRRLQNVRCTWASSIQYCSQTYV